MSDNKIVDEAYAIMNKLHDWMGLLILETNCLTYEDHKELTIDKWLNKYIQVTRLPYYKKAYDIYFFNEALIMVARIGFIKAIDLFVTWGATAYDEAMDAAIIGGHKSTARYIFENSSKWIEMEQNKSRDRSIFPVPLLKRSEKHMLKAKIE